MVASRSHLAHVQAKEETKKHLLPNLLLKLIKLLPRLLMPWMKDNKRELIKKKLKQLSLKLKKSKKMQMLPRNLNMKSTRSRRLSRRLPISKNLLIKQRMPRKQLRNQLKLLVKP